MAGIKLHCLDRVFISFDVIQKNLDLRLRDTRAKNDAVLRFISLNRSALEFLGVTAQIEEKDNMPGVVLSSSKYVGCAPLVSISTGKVYENLYITPRFGESLEELAYVLEETISPEFSGQELYNVNKIPAPLYLECINYFKVFAKAIDFIWNKFDVIRKNESVPSSSTDWKKYIERSHNPQNAFSFSNRKSIQSKNHREWKQLTYMAKIALDIFMSPETPPVLKFNVKPLTDYLTRYVAIHAAEPVNQLFTVKALDPNIIRELKQLANVLISRKKDNRLAWRMDCAELFERYVQFIIQKSARTIGARCVSNSRIAVSGSRPKWCLNYIEPDVMLVSDDRIIMMDAKYKAHMLNTDNETVDFKDTFRHDFHQLLAYSTFDSSVDKMAALIYPHTGFTYKQINVGRGFARTDVKVFLIGVPITGNAVKISEISARLTKVFSAGDNGLFEHQGFEKVP